MDAGPPGALPNGRQDRFRREWMLGQLHPEGFSASSIVEMMEAVFVLYQWEGHRRRYCCEACGQRARRKAMRMKTPSLPVLPPRRHFGFLPSGQAHRQRLHRVVQWQVSGGMLERALVHEPRRRAAKMRGLA